MRRIPLALFVALVPCLALGACTAPVGRPGPIVVMISMDGTRPADLAAGRLPSLTRLAERGAIAEKLLPSFPSNTFPNHVTLVTGVAPERHGLVDNTFIDPERGLFERQDVPTWIDVEPIWSLLAREGIVSASYYWVGSAGDWPGGSGPRYWKRFSDRTGEAEKVEQILEWLDLPEPRRPRLITSWFHGADGASHRHGPDSDEVVRSLAAQDLALAALIDGIADRGLWEATTLLVVSDHGMMVPQRRVDLVATLGAAGIEARVIGGGGFASVHVSQEDAPRAVDVARGLGLSAWRREDAPAALRVANPRFGPVVVVAPRGTAIVRKGLAKKGFHGHAPDVPEMAAILVAAGRGVAPATRLPEIPNVDVAPTVLRLLGVPVPGWMEGRPIPELSAR